MSHDSTGCASSQQTTAMLLLRLASSSVVSSLYLLRHSSSYCTSLPKPRSKWSSLRPRVLPFEVTAAEGLTRCFLALSLPQSLPMLCHLPSTYPSSAAKCLLLLPSIIPGVPRTLLHSWHARGCNNLEMPIVQMREWHWQIKSNGMQHCTPASNSLVVPQQISKWRSVRVREWNFPRWWMNSSLSGTSGLCDERSPRWLTLARTVEALSPTTVQLHSCKAFFGEQRLWEILASEVTTILSKKT